MQKKIVLLLILVMLCFSGCSAPGTSAQTEADSSVEMTEAVELKTGESVIVTVSMEDSGAIKSMALSFSFDDDAFEVVDGGWLGKKSVIEDFNKENKDAVIAFMNDTNYSGEIFELELKAKQDISVSDDMITVKPVLKNEQLSIECKGIELSFAKK